MMAVNERVRHMSYTRGMGEKDNDEGSRKKTTRRKNGSEGGGEVRCDGKLRVTEQPSKVRQENAERKRWRGDGRSARGGNGEGGGRESVIGLLLFRSLLCAMPLKSFASRCRSVHSQLYRSSRRRSVPLCLIAAVAWCRTPFFA